MRRVLVVAFDFPPQGGTGAIRVTKFVKYLPQFGWQPVVVASDAAWNPDRSLLDDVPPDVVIRRVSWPAPVRRFQPGPSSAATSSGSAAPTVTVRLRHALRQLVRRVLVPDVNVLWVRGARRACAQVLQEYHCDAVLTTSPPHSVHLVGTWLRSCFGLPWIADFRDEWTVDNPELPALGWLNYALQRRMERRVLDLCTYALAVTEPLAQRQVEAFDLRPANKVRCITNGFDPADFAGSELPFARDLFVLTYVGVVSGLRISNAFPEGLRIALSQSEDFRKAARVRFVGQLDPAYRVRLAGLERNVELCGFAPHGAAIEAIRSAHMLLLILPNIELSRMTFTNKFFEYLAARRPILAIVPPGVIRDIVEQEGVGLVASPDDAAAIAQALLTAFETLRTQPDHYHTPDALLARFDRRELTRTLAEMLDTACGLRKE